MQTKFFSHYVPILPSFVLYNPSLHENITHLLCVYKDLHNKVQIWAVLVDADK